jgi:hypothetical protein
MALKKKWSAIKRLPEKVKEIEENEMAEYMDKRPSMFICSETLPDIKDWEVGMEYNVNVVLKVESKSDEIDRESGKHKISVNTRLAGISNNKEQA